MLKALSDAQKGRGTRRAEEHRSDALLQARLFPDMFPLVRW
jgi:hypothetical protein